MSRQFEFSPLDPKYSIRPNRLGLDPAYKILKKDLNSILRPESPTTNDSKTLKAGSRKKIFPRSQSEKTSTTILKTTEEIEMKRIGLDLGTKHIVLAWRDDNNKVKSRFEVNGYLTIPRPDSFTEQLLQKSGVPYIKNDDEIIAIGGKAEQLAYTFNKTLKRPMAEGSLSKDDEYSQEIMAIIIRSIIKSAVGKLDDGSLIYFCTTADAINSTNLNISFHKKIVELIIKGYATEAKVNANHINEARCLVVEETGAAIGISWGAGTVTVHAGIFGVPIFEFSIVGAGDWIDTEAAKRFGYDPAYPGKDSLETPTSICRKKESLDLTLYPAKKDDKVGLAIYLMYEILVENVVRGIVKGFNENRDKCRFDKPVPIVNAGGTSMPNGFMELFKKKLDEVRSQLSFPVGDVRRADDPLFAVARGCLVAAEMHKDSTA